MLLAAGAWGNHLWHLVPLVASISLVYGATRHELMGPILINAGRMAKWLLSFMLVVFLVLATISWFVI